MLNLVSLWQTLKQNKNLFSNRLKNTLPANSNTDIHRLPLTF